MPCQHREVKHRTFECPECDREFTTEDAMDQVRARSRALRLLPDALPALRRKTPIRMLRVR